MKSKRLKAKLIFLINFSWLSSDPLGTEIAVSHSGSNVVSKVLDRWCCNSQNHVGKLPAWRASETQAASRPQWGCWTRYASLFFHMETVTWGLDWAMIGPQFSKDGWLEWANSSISSFSAEPYSSVKLKRYDFLFFSWVLIKLYLQKQATGWLWLGSCSLQSLAPDKQIIAWWLPYKLF